MMNKKMILSVILAGMLTAGSIAVPLEGIDPPFSITASAATTSQIQQLQSDVQTIANHINYVSYIKRGKASNRYNVVCAYQRTLNTLYGAGLAVDGVFGQASERATRDVQRSAGISADGIAGVGTLKVIREKANAYIDANTSKSASVYFSSISAPSTIMQGSSYYLGGTISSSGAPISSFKGEILSGNTVKMSKTMYPNAYSVNISYSAVDNSLKFGQLGAGTYTLRYTVTAGSTTKTYTKDFTVQSKRASISFNSMSAPNSINKGNSYVLSGTIKATNQPIYYITAQIKDSNNTPVFSKTVYPNSYSYSIKYSAIDTAMKFGRLSAGNYTLVYDVVARDITTSSKSYSFKVVDPTQEVNVPANVSNNASKLVQTAKADIGKTSAQMGFPRDQAWCAYSAGKWLNNIGINLGSTPLVNDVAERLVSRGYSSTAFVFRDSKGRFTNGNLYNLYGSGKVQRIENRYDVTPQPGDIICFKWRTSSYENYSHIGIVVSYDPATKTIVTIEGNAGSGSANTTKVTLYDGSYGKTRMFDNQVVALVRLK